MQFEHDIFISYAHLDDESPMADKKGWISEFHRGLEIMIGQLMGSKPVIWRDRDLNGSHVFDKEIVDKFAKVALMISIVTPRYVKSEWCLKEVNEFREECSQNIGFVVKNKARVFKVIKTPVPQDAHPDPIKNILGYEFYGTDPHTNRVRDFSPFFTHTEKDYWDKMGDLANDIRVFLEELKSVNAPNTSTPAPAPLPQHSARKVKNVYLSESSYDTKDLRDSVKRELQDHGYNILPYGQLSLVGPVLKENVNQAMSEAQLAIHIMGNNYGIIPEGAEKSIVEIQNEIGASKSVSDNLARLIWIPENTDPGDDRQKAFLQKLNSGSKDVITGADLITGSVEDFKSVMHDKLKSMEEVAPQPVAQVQAESSGVKMVYLICDIQDQELITPLEDFLWDNKVEVIKPIFDGDETEIREDHIENLQNCSAAIIFFGNGSEAWQRNKMRDFMKYRPTKPLGFKVVYLAEPSSPAKLRYRTLDAEIVNGIDGLPENELKNLLSKL